MTESDRHASLNLLGMSDQVEMQLEVCVETVASAVAAMEGGADRIEICTGLAVGGLTPSLGLVSRITRLASSHPHPRPKITVLIRPSPDPHFVLSPDELETALDDIRAFARVKHDTSSPHAPSPLIGVAIGCLDAEGEIDAPSLAALGKAALAGGLEITLHRAVDVGSLGPLESLLASLAVLDEIGIPPTRVLTSGGASSAMDGLDVISTMIAATKDHPVAVTAAGGVRVDLLPSFMEAGLSSLHGSFRHPPSQSSHPPSVRSSVSLFGLPTRSTDPLQVSQARQTLHQDSS